MISGCEMLMGTVPITSFAASMTLIVLENWFKRKARLATVTTGAGVELSVDPDPPQPTEASSKPMQEMNRRTNTRFNDDSLLNANRI